MRGVSLAMASLIAMREVRCRSAIADIIGRPAAKALTLTACQGGPYDDPQFLVGGNIDWALWLKIADVPGLIRPLEDRPQD